MARRTGWSPRCVPPPDTGLRAGGLQRSREGRAPASAPAHARAPLTHAPRLCPAKQVYYRVCEKISKSKYVKKYNFKYTGVNGNGN